VLDIAVVPTYLGEVRTREEKETYIWGGKFFIDAERREPASISASSVCFDVSLS
jgi:hypothetical protein